MADASPLRQSLNCQILSPACPPGAPPLPTACGLAANALSREQGRLGKAEGRVAGARMLARIIWALKVQPASF